MTSTQLQNSAQAGRHEILPARHFAFARALNDARFYSNAASFPVDKEARVRWSHVEAEKARRRGNAEILIAFKLLS